MNFKFLIFHKLFFLIFLFWGITNSLKAETVILRTHEVIHGKITYQDAKVLRMKGDDGKPIEFQKNDILKVSYRDVKDAEEIKKIIKEEENKLPPEKRKKVVAPEIRNKYKVTLQSAVLPGWGQWKTGNKLYAVLSFAAVAGAGSYATSRYSAFKSENRKYDVATFQNTLLIARIFDGQFTPGAIATSFILNSKSYEPFYEAQNRGNDAMRFVGLMYGLQLVHSYFLGRAWEKADPNTSIGKKAAFGGWNINAVQRQAFSYTGSTRESYYEASYNFQF